MPNWARYSFWGKAVRNGMIVGDAVEFPMEEEALDPIGIAPFAHFLESLESHRVSTLSERVRHPFPTPEWLELPVRQEHLCAPLLGF